MSEKISVDCRKGVLYATTSLVVAFVRNYFQYHVYGWKSVSSFLTSWFIHTLGMALFLVISSLFIDYSVLYILGEEFRQKKLSQEELLIHITLFILVTSVIIFLFAHYIPIESKSELGLM